VLRLLPVFDTPQAAIRYATDQGMTWLGTPAPAHAHLIATLGESNAIVSLCLYVVLFIILMY